MTDFTPHSDYEELIKLLPAVERYQELASKHGIYDVFQDNGGKLLQVLLLLGIKDLPGREGNDAVDSNGNEFELKSVNRLDMRGKERNSPSFTTHHHLNSVILEKYRKVDWIFSVYRGISLEAIYLMKPSQLEIYFTKWEDDYVRTGKERNNPKFPIKFIEENGRRLYP